jgi:uncharacterized protein (TIGR03382 family)
VLSLLFVLAMGACGGNFGGCSSCATAGPLPPGGLPADQTIEGGAQIRVTPSGFDKMTSVLPGILNSAFGSGFTIPGGSVSLLFTVDYCGGTGGAGCKVAVKLNSANASVTNQNTLQIAIDASGSTSVPLSAFIGSCTLSVSVAHLIANADISLGINATTGDLTVTLNQINQFSFNGQSFSGCGIISDVADVLTDILNSAIGQFVIQLLTPTLNGLVQSLLPNPLGIANTENIGQLLAGVSPSTEAAMQVVLEPGGYVALNDGGMSLGMITGFNSNRDPGGSDASAPALCVPPIPITNYGQPPYSLPLTSRSTFALSAVPPLDGSPDPASDFALGISQTTLNLLGHHLVTSGAMCLGVGTSLIPQLNVGTLGIIVPSLAELDPTGMAPLLLVTRPQRELTMTVGDNTSTSPGITIHISHLQVDFYGFLYERYVRAFTMDISLDVGVTLDFAPQTAGQPIQIMPILSGINAQDVTLTVLNSEFVAESPAMLQAVLPSVFDLVTPLLGNIPAITIPSFAGFTIENPSIVHIPKSPTTSDDFLAIYASFGASPDFRQLAKTDPFASVAVQHMDDALPAMQPASTGTAKLLGVNTPAPAAIRAALQNEPGGAMPTITFAVDSTDSLGRKLEWSWNLDGGLWRPWVSTDRLVIQDRALAWQGHFTVGLRSRVVGDWRTTADQPSTQVLVDSVPPAFGQMVVANDTFTMPVTDIIDNDSVEVAWGRPSEDKPAVAWTQSNQIALTKDAAAAFSENGQIALWARDPAGNTTTSVVSPFGATESSGGCAAGGTPTTGAVLLFGLVGVALLVPRRRLRTIVRFGGAWVVLATAMSLVPGCSCHTNQGAACKTGSDCPASTCGSGEIPVCLEGQCVCTPDVPVGTVGPYSAVAVDTNGNTWVSAYSQTYGDLCVANVGSGVVPDTAWEWVDGVPSGPVIAPGSMIRGGIMAAGPNVGMYTSIKVASDGTPEVTYFDVDNAALKYAARVNGTWQMHTVDAGNGAGSDGPFVGMYTSLTLRADNSFPGVAYLAHVPDGSGGEHAEVRFAQATTAQPMQASDWQTFVVDTGEVPSGSGDVYPLPNGLGLFVSATRDPNTQAPVVAYYDRGTGELKMSTFDAGSGQFATPVVLSNTTENAGWSPSVQIGSNSVAQVAYVDVTHNDLELVSSGSAGSNDVVDDGYRIVGTTVDGLPEPTFDFVGYNASLVLVGGTQPVIAYQDATVQQLMLAYQGSDGTWTHDVIAGGSGSANWPGAFGFYASAALTSSQIVMSTWVIDQPTMDNWVQVFNADIPTLQ